MLRHMMWQTLTHHLQAGLEPVGEPRKRLHAALGFAPLRRHAGGAGQPLARPLGEARPGCMLGASRMPRCRPPRTFLVYSRSFMALSGSDSVATATAVLMSSQRAAATADSMAAPSAGAAPAAAASHKKQVSARQLPIDNRQEASLLGRRKDRRAALTVGAGLAEDGIRIQHGLEEVVHAVGGLVASERARGYISASGSPWVQRRPHSLEGRKE